MLTRMSVSLPLYPVPTPVRTHFCFATTSLCNHFLDCKYNNATVTMCVWLGETCFLLSWMHSKVREHTSSSFHYILMSIYLCVCGSTCFNVHNVTVTCCWQAESPCVTIVVGAFTCATVCLRCPLLCQ